MKKLLQFLDSYNTTEFQYPEEGYGLSDKLAQYYRDILHCHYVKPVERDNTKPSVSKLAKPGIIVAYDYFHPSAGEVHSYAKMRKFLGGHTFELEVLYWLERLGYQYKYQPEFVLEQGVVGHPDIVAREDKNDTAFIIECKHMGSSTYKSAAKTMSNQAYITQLAMYCTKYQTDGLWIMGNTDTGELSYIHFPYKSILDSYMHYVDAAYRTHSIVTTASSFEECLEFIAPPKPLQRKDGTRYIPPSMYISKGVLHKAASLYALDVVDSNVNVVGYNYPEGAKQWEPVL
jgi:hypothetical protein